MSKVENVKIYRNLSTDLIKTLG